MVGDSFMKPPRGICFWPAKVLETPEGKKVLARGSFAKHPREKCFWSATVSRNPRGGKCFVLNEHFGLWQFRKTPEGKNVLIYDIFTKSPKGKKCSVRREHEQPRPHPQYNEQRKINILRGCLFLVPVFTLHFDFFLLSFL